MKPEVLYNKYLYADENHNVESIKTFFKMILIKFHEEWVDDFHPELLI